MNARSEREAKRPGISLFIPPEAPQRELSFAAQLGAAFVYTWVPPDATDVASLSRLRARVEEAGLTLYNVGCLDLGKSYHIQLASSERDRYIDRFREFIENLGAAGIGVTTFTWEPDGVWSSERRESTRGASARAVDLDELTGRPFTRGRRYEAEELWDNFAYFIQALAPALRASKVRLALHPNDPPTPSPLGGIDCLIHGIDDYERAFSHAPSELLGMEFCCGCWLEGASTLGDPAQAMRRFCADGRVLIVHFRNVSAPLPRFVETFLDNGYGEMYPIVRTLYESGYSGSITPDHVPKLVEPYGSGASFAYAVGYMRALMERAEAEAGQAGSPG